MNKGIILSKGDWLYFLGTGDVFYNGSVLEQVFVNSFNENTNLIAGKTIYEGETKPFIYSKGKMVKNNWLDGKRSNGEWPNGHDVCSSLQGFAFVN